jgi:hypothetical protein
MRRRVVACKVGNPRVLPGLDLPSSGRRALKARQRNYFRRRDPRMRLLPWGQRCPTRPLRRRDRRATLSSFAFPRSLGPTALAATRLGLGMLVGVGGEAGMTASSRPSDPERQPWYCGSQPGYRYDRGAGGPHIGGGGGVMAGWLQRGTHGPTRTIGITPHFPTIGFQIS